MNTTEVGELREDLRQKLDRLGFGAITKLSRAAAYSTTQIYKFLNADPSVSEECMLKLREKVNDLIAEAANEEPSRFGGIVVTEIVVCPGCHQKTPQVFERRTACYCCNCGASIVVECPNPKCGLANVLHADFCEFCNTPLSDAAVVIEAQTHAVTSNALKGKTDRIRDKDKAARKKGQPGF